MTWEEVDALSLFPFAYHLPRVCRRLSLFDFLTQFLVPKSVSA